MKNSIYQDTAICVAFYDNKAFKSIGELREYLKITCNFTEEGINVVVTSLPRITRAELTNFLKEAEVCTPNRVAKIKTMANISDESTTETTLPAGSIPKVNVIDTVTKKRKSKRYTKRT